jgi:hypothetical protein
MIKLGKKPTAAGFSPYRILELFQRMRISFRLWRTENNRQKRQWIEQRIINDAGILGHYVTDMANPHHATIHFNGWDGPNPNGYTTYSRERGIHFRFEEEFVGAQVVINDLYPLTSSQARTINQPREELWNYVKSSNALVEQLYILTKWNPLLRLLGHQSTRNLQSRRRRQAQLCFVICGGQPGSPALAQTGRDSLVERDSRTGYFLVSVVPDAPEDCTIPWWKLELITTSQ